MGKDSARRKCLISREEEDLRYGLALGYITFEEWFIGMQKLKAAKDSKGVCGQCKDGLMVGPDYEITCRITNELHDQRHTCAKFREDE